MNKLISFQDYESFFIEDEGKNELIESISDFLSDDEKINEGFFDKIKNTLSKSLLGSLSYINIIDKVRSEILNLEKEVLTKRYKFLDEIDSLKKEMAEASKSEDKSRALKIKEVLELKKKEHDTYENSSNTRIEKALNMLKDSIKGNKRRSDYYEAGKSQDELELAEFEYSLAKKRSETGSDELKKLLDDLNLARADAAKKQDELKSAQKDAKKDAERSKKQIEEEGVKTLETSTPDFKKSLRSVAGCRALLLYLKGQKDKLEDSLLDVKNEFVKGEIKNSIQKTKSDISVVQKALEQHQSKKIMKSQKEHEELMIRSSQVISKNNEERKKAIKKAEDIIGKSETKSDSKKKSISSAKQKSAANK